MQRVVQLGAAKLVHSVKSGPKGHFMKFCEHVAQQLETADQLEWCTVSMCCHASNGGLQMIKPEGAG
jgi:hypothetical protein